MQPNLPHDVVEEVDGRYSAIFVGTQQFGKQRWPEELSREEEASVCTYNIYLSIYST